MKYQVNVATDFSLGPVGWHFYVPIPPVTAPVPTYAFEMVATQMWTAGLLLNKNKFTSTVKHRGMPVVLDGHDVGPLIPDLTVPFPNAYYAAMWPLSSRKVVVTAFRVTMDGKATAITQYIGGPPVPMLSCGNPVSNPSVYSVLNAVNNTVQVGIDVEDLIAGFITVAFTMLADFIAYRLDPPGNMLGWGHMLWTGLAGNMFPGLSRNENNTGFAFSRGAFRGGAAKFGAGLLSGFLVSFVRRRQMAGRPGADVPPYSVPLQPVDTPYGGGGGAFNWGSSDPLQNGWSVSGGGAGTGWERSPDGTVTRTRFGGPLNPSGFGSSVTTARDGTATERTAGPRPGTVQETVRNSDGSVRSRTIRGE